MRDSVINCAGRWHMGRLWARVLRMRMNWCRHHRGHLWPDGLLLLKWMWMVGSMVSLMLLLCSRVVHHRGMLSNIKLRRRHAQVDAEHLMLNVMWWSCRGRGLLYHARSYNMSSWRKRPAQRRPHHCSLSYRWRLLLHWLLGWRLLVLTRWYGGSRTSWST